LKYVFFQMNAPIGNINSNGRFIVSSISNLKLLKD